MMNRNSGRFLAIKNLAISLKVHVFHSPAIIGDAGDSAYWTSGDYRAHMIETENRRAQTLAESRMLRNIH